MRELDFIDTMLNESSAYIRERYSDRLHIEVAEKDEANNLLTEVDIAVQKRVVGKITAHFPCDFIVAEEAGMDVNPSDENRRCWLLDPIDGTQNFIRGLFPAFGISLAFAMGGSVAAGGISLPVIKDMFLAERGSGAFRNGKRIRVSDVDDISRARIEIDFVRLSKREQLLTAAAQVLQEVGQVRSVGCAVVALCSVIAGDSDGYLHIGLKPWDYAAGMLMLEEAGGAISRLDGSPVALFDGKSGILASNAALHSTFLSLVRH